MIFSLRFWFVIQCRMVKVVCYSVRMLGHLSMNSRTNMMNMTSTEFSMFSTTTTITKKQRTNQQHLYDVFSWKTNKQTITQQAIICFSWEHDEIQKYSRDVTEWEQTSVWQKWLIWSKIERENGNCKQKNTDIHSVLHTHTFLCSTSSQAVHWPFVINVSFSFCNR